MKWLRRLLVSRKKRTPLPPKPYVDTASAGKHMIDARYYDANDLAQVDPEAPHWKDPRYESREQVPFFDFFGYNRDWSWSLFKVAAILSSGVMYYEVRTYAYMKDTSLKVSSTTSISAAPDYARDDKATEEELRAAGYQFVGVKQLDQLGIQGSGGKSSATGRDG